MPNVLDVILLLLVVLFAVSGYRQGFLVGALSFIGFLGGGVLGAKIAKPFTGLIGQEGHGALVGLLVVLGLALAGQVAGTAVGVALRDRMTWRPGRAVDAAAGAVLSGVSVLLIAWLLANVADRSPFESLARSVHDSRVLATVDAGMPDGVRETFADLRQLADDKAFPEVFARLGDERIIAAGPPDPATAQTAGVQAAAASIVKIRGVAQACDQRVEGSGFVIAPQRVMTNAHVVAGVRHPTVVLSTGTVAAQVVVFDPDKDIAVLRVPDLQRPPLRIRTSPPAAAEEPAVIAGYPQDGPYTTVAARVRNHQRAPRGEHLRARHRGARHLRGSRPGAARELGRAAARPGRDRARRGVRRGHRRRRHRIRAQRRRGRAARRGRQRRRDAGQHAGMRLTAVPGSRRPTGADGKTRSRAGPRRRLRSRARRAARR